jgi:tRNA threonylcarbamoyladenosine biosynthesis protein TsaB
MVDGTTLVVDASGRAAMLCVIEAGKVLASVHMEQRQQSRLLADAMQTLCSQANRSWSDLQRLLYVQGPGSFTGLRIAAATLNGVNTALHCPVACVSSLAVTAVACADDQPHWVLEDARSGEVFVGYYQGITALQDDACLAWSQLDEQVITHYTGSSTCSEHFSGGRFIAPTMERVAALAIVSTLPLPTQQYATPCYVQRSQAERNQKA